MNSLRLILSNRRYLGPALVFTTFSMIFGTWAIYIPVVKEKLGIDKGQLGMAIFFLSLGVFTIFPIASRIINRMGVGRATWYGVVLCCLTGIFPLLAPNLISLMIALFVMGASSGFTDISINTLVAEIEKKDKVKIMSASHGFFSLGGIFAGLGSFLILGINNPALHMALVSAVLFLINLYFYKNYFNLVAENTKNEAFSLKLFKPLLLLGLISFISMGSEGAIVDWSGLYLKEVVQAPEMLWGAGFLGFQITMTLGRFLGDGVSNWLGSFTMVSLGAFLAIVGYVLVLTDHTYLSIMGFAVCGLGFSALVPELFRIGGNIKGVSSSQGVSFIAGSGYTGFLVAPPILGFLADAYSLRTCFMLLMVLALIPLFISMQQRRKP